VPPPKLRVARPSDNIEALVPFYRDGLGLDVLSRFEDHDGFDGVMLGAPNAAYHFEFTRKRGHVAARAPSQDNLLVFYYPDVEEWRAATERMRHRGFEPVPSFNPYWDRVGLTFEDPDGYRVVIAQSGWDQ
jgi:catechol 2,3-dioxygenase-like lactoylglutathione lyase family enzyme